jgi:hypothetical protein
MEEYDQFTFLVWAFDSPSTLDSLDMVLSSDESILEDITCIENPLEDMHHKSYFLLELSRMEVGDKGIIIPGVFD